MRINTDFSRRVVVRPEDHEWVKSPETGVERLMLDRIGGEVARATTIVRFQPGSRFPEHEHGGGEEFLVLDGVFSDENGDYPAGTYVRNPVGSRHAPFSEVGATLFVKLHQFQSGAAVQKVVDTRRAPYLQGLVDGLSVLPLHVAGSENVALVKWAPGTRFQAHAHWGGEEILVLDGVFEDEHGRYPKGSWIRSPHGSTHAPFTKEGALIYVKTGALPASGAA